MKLANLKIAESYTRDVGRGIVRIDYSTMEKLGVNTGNFVGLGGLVTALGIALPLYPSDEGKGIIRMDKIMRENSGLKIGDNIKIQKYVPREANTINVKALGEPWKPLREEYLTECMVDIGVIKGNKILIPFYGSRLEFLIESTDPDSPVVVKRNTTFIITNLEKSIIKPDLTKDEFFRLSPEMRDWTLYQKLSDVIKKLSGIS